MNKGKLKVLLFDLKNIVEEIESEIYSDISAYTTKQEVLSDFPQKTTDYDEVFDDDGYPD
tara:strand:+ start:5286 stop:5465 length:180 start_codon:yes stop_codon:yes gene_type:complete